MFRNFFLVRVHILLSFFLFNKTKNNQTHKHSIEYFNFSNRYIYNDNNNFNVISKIDKKNLISYCRNNNNNFI